MSKGEYIMVEFKGIEIKYGDFVAMQDMNLTINEGEFFTFLGPSGCGKTTSLRTLVGFITPSKGEILIDGKNIVNVPVEKRQIGMVFQSYALFPTMTVYENIAYGLKIKKLKKDEIDKKVKEVAKKIKITNEQLKKNVAELSGGQQQRVALARAIVLEPKILCLDEPLSNLDAKLRVDLRRELKRLQKELGITTLYVTHDQEEALTLSDRIAVFNNGYIEQVGTKFEIYNHSASEFVCEFIGDINKLGKNIIKHLNTISDTKFDINKKAFVRIERCLTYEKKGFIKFEVQVEDYEFNGVLTKYTATCMGESIKFLEKNDGYTFYEIGEKVSLYINPKEIMQF
jgi:iron(III) transport system ATP-binding protein